MGRPSGVKLVRGFPLPKLERNAGLLEQLTIHGEHAAKAKASPLDYWDLFLGASNDIVAGIGRREKLAQLDMSCLVEDDVVKDILRGHGRIRELFAIKCDATAENRFNECQAKKRLEYKQRLVLFADKDPIRVSTWKIKKGSFGVADGKKG